MKETPPPRVLVVDDQADVVEALRLLLKGAGVAVTSARSPAAAIALLDGIEVDAALIDMNFARDTTSGGEGLDLLSRLLELDATLPVVVMTAWGTVDGAVEAMRRGARDYVQKPWDNTRLVATMRAQIDLSRALRTSRRADAERSRRDAQDRPPVVAESRAMQGVMQVVERVAPSDANVLLVGAHGTGKEVVARYVHAASSRRAAPFVVVHAGALADGVFESELFGHVRGAFTDAKTDKPGCFALADGGTLFLDEVGTMPPAQQAKLLRVLQTGDFTPVGSSKLCRADVRVVAATNLDLARAVAEGRFREDLVYRLNTIEVRLPALRDRREDIPVLAGVFLAKLAKKYAGTPDRFSARAMDALLEHPWPGNVRELEHAVERAALLARGAEIEPDDLGLRAVGADGAALERMTLDEAEAHLIQRALARHEGNVIAAAKALGLSRSALYRRLAHHGMKAPG